MKRILALPFVMTAGAAAAQPVAPPTSEAPLPTGMVRQPDGTCLQVSHRICPPDVPCNPPPPQVVPCPDALPEAGPDDEVTPQPDGRCLAFPRTFRCVPGATCNPPAPRQVRCAPAVPPAQPATADQPPAP